MRRRSLFGLILSVALMPELATGEARDWADQLSRNVEMPSHRWLEKLRRSPDAELAPFTTDGCSGGMSSLWTFTAERFPAFADAHEGVPPWQECCVTHDRAYHIGGKDPTAEASYDARLEADNVLRACVEGIAVARDEDLGALYDLTPQEVQRVYRAIASGMFQAVRLGGGPCTGLSWRWGYGYDQCWPELP